MTVGTPSSTMATQEFVVPRSIPMTRSIQSMLLSGRGRAPRSRPMLACFAVLLRLFTNLGVKVADPGVVRRKFSGSLDLGERALLEAGGQVGPHEREPEIRDARIELDRPAGELDRAPRVRRRFQGGEGDPLVRARV